MSKREWELYLKDIDKSINKIIKYTKGMGREDFFYDDKTLTKKNKA